MHEPLRVSLPRLSAARALILLAAMAGLLAVHGLTDHGASHWGEHVTVGAVTAEGVHALSHDPTSSAGPESKVMTRVSSFAGTDDDGFPVDMGLMALCLAVLSMVGLFSASSRRSRARPIRLVRTLLHHFAAGPLLLRTADPPDRHCLQVHRC